MQLATIAEGLISATPGYRETTARFDDPSTVEAYLTFERALARVQGALGIIPADAAATVVEVCRLENVDLDGLRAGTARVGYVIVPLVAMLAEKAGPHGEWLHYGTTTQDVMDTGLALQLRDAAPGLLGTLGEVCQLLASLAEAHRRTPMAGRSKLQHAAPISFGYRCAVWLDQIHRRAERLADALEGAATLQYGGAVGTLAALGADGIAVREGLARELGLAEPEITWHVSRDRFADATHAFSAATAALAKMAGDITFLMATEVAELREPYSNGRGSSSTMPQKRNPVISEAIIEAARRTRLLPAALLEAMTQDQDRGIATAYLERGAIVDAARLTAGAASLAVELVGGLEVDVARMRTNLGATGGLIHAEAAMMALSAEHGRVAAHTLLHALCHEASVQRRDLAEVAAAKGYALAPEIFDPGAGLGSQDAMIDAVLARTRPPANGSAATGAVTRP
ncbi:class-II fumarase/aspartase family protein [Acuticoccus sediminis]|uniref:class-II fumarase/aspartase family protein n=1 Tax=Acuticoccus sediminis TaxID=2184697 RepID=UPI001CFF055B|nr:adenylosuccinate lyase family protein [Acuticoccus sediminis]